MKKKKTSRKINHIVAKGYKSERRERKSSRERYGSKVTLDRKSRVAVKRARSSCTKRSAFLSPPRAVYTHTLVRRTNETNERTTRSRSEPNPLVRAHVRTYVRTYVHPINPSFVDASGSRICAGRGISSPEFRARPANFPTRGFERRRIFPIPSPSIPADRAGNS